MLNYRTALTADLPTMMKMVEEAKEGFRARNIDQWQKGEPNEQGLTEGIEKSVVHVLEENGEVLGMITVVPGPEADYAVIDGAWLNDEPYFAFHRVCVSRHTKEKDWLQASSLILKHLQKGVISYRTHRTISPCRSINQKAILSRKDHIMFRKRSRNPRFAYRKF
ncbi:MAG: hypothetical protein ACLUB3_03345 [Clostridium sp.]